MKIAHFSESLNEGGIAAFLANLVPAQSKNNQVEIVTVFKNDKIPNGLGNTNIKITSLNNPSSLLSCLYFPFLILKKIWELDSEIIHIHGSFIYYIIAIFLLHNKKKFFYTVHSDAFKEKNSSRFEALIWPIKKLFFKKGWIKPVTISAQSEDSFYRLYGFHAKTIINGIRLKEADKSTDILKYKNTPNTRLFVHAGRISDAKNQEVMCNAFKRLIEDGNDVHLIIAGAIQDEIIFSRLKPYWCSRITYLGSRSDILEIFRTADFMLLPSKWEGMPMTLLEAMSQGCVPICSPVGGIPSVIVNLQNGILSTDYSEDSIYEALKLSSNLSSETRKLISNNCLKSVKEFSIEKTAIEYLEYYKT
ncbi:MAG: glycosyltransferase family 4 protein [Muribaculaceae bacterium]|nr:glycosyltransferase family 4 protein [Muribaculaceae bacterium]